MSKRNDYDYLIKLLLIGDSGERLALHSRAGAWFCWRLELL